jgi:hypothetical protein
MTDLRLDGRRSLLTQFNQHADAVERSPAMRDYDHYKQQAIELVTGGRARDAFDLRKEPEAIRDRYGRDKYGQSVLLARRLVEAGVSLVQVQWASLDKKRFAPL